MGDIIKGIFYFFVVYIILYWIFDYIPEEAGWATLSIVNYAVLCYLGLKVVKFVCLVIRKGKYNKRVEEFALLLEEKCKELGMFTIQEIFDEIRNCPRGVELLIYLHEKINYPFSERAYVAKYIDIFCEEKLVERKCDIQDENGKKTGALYAAVNADIHATNMLPAVVLQID